MARVSKPSDFGLGGGRIKPLDAPRRRANASPEAFGAGRTVESFGGGVGPEGYGGGRNLESFGGGRTVESFGSGPALVSQETSLNAMTAYLAVQRRDTIAQANADSLKARGEYDQGLSERQAAIEPGTDPGEFHKQELERFDEWQAKLLDGATGVRRKMLAQDLGQYRLSVQRDAIGFEGTRRREYREAQNKLVYDQTVDQAGSARNAAYSRPDDLATLQQQQARLIEATALPDDVKAKLHRTVNGALADAAWQGRVDADPYAVKAALERGDPAEMQGLEFDDRVKVINQAQSEINRREAEARAAEAERKAAARQARMEALQRQQFRIQQLGDDVGGIIDAAQRGLPLAGVGDVAKRLQEEAGSTADPDILRSVQVLQDRVNTAMAGSEFAREFAMTPVADQTKILDDLLTTPREPDQAALAAVRYDIATKVLKANVDAVNEGRQLQRANELGVVKLEPLDLTDPASIAKRVDDARLAGAFLGTGTQSPQLFTKEELAGEAKRFASMAGEQRAQYMQQLQIAAGDQYPEIMRQLTAKGGLDRASQYVSILAGRPEAAPVMNAVGEAMDAKPEELKANVLRSGWSEADINREVEKSLRQWMTTVGQTYAQGATGATQMQADVFDMVTQTAKVLMRTHGPAEAVKMAADQIINERYEFRDGYRIPKPAQNATAYIEGVDRMMADTMAALSPELVDPKGSRYVPAPSDGTPEGDAAHAAAVADDERVRRQGYVEAVKNRGQWVTLPDESGLVLTDEQGSVVSVKGQPVLVKFGTIP